MFDASKLVTLDGTVKEFQWTNPHAWIYLMVPDSDGPPAQWAIEMNGPTGLVRDGWFPKTLTPGMKVQVVVHPLRDGNNGGQYLAVTLPDGTVMGNPGPWRAGSARERHTDRRRGRAGDALINRVRATWTRSLSGAR